MANWLFWMVAGAMVLAVAAILTLATRQRGRLAADQDARVYRDQLAEVERDAARGLIAGDEAERLRTEVARRLLSADRVTAPQASGAGPGWIAMGLVALSCAAAFAVYLDMGAPGYPDLPIRDRIAQAEAERDARASQAELEAMQPKQSVPVDPEFAKLMDKLRAAVKARPDDLTGLQLLARNEASLGNFAASRDAQERVIALRGAEVRAQDWVALASVMLQSAGGKVSPEAEAALGRAMVLEPDNDAALFFLGISNLQVGRADLGFRFWRRYLEVAPPDSPWMAQVREGMPELARLAGARYELPALRGPGAADVEAAQDMSPEDRNVMIRGMVDQLSERLATEGGEAEEWGRLIRSLAILGDMDRARAIYAEAQQVFAGRTVELSGLRQIAVEAGVAE